MPFSVPEPSRSREGNARGGAARFSRHARWIALAVVALCAGLTTFAVLRLAALDDSDSQSLLNVEIERAEQILADQLARHRQFLLASAGFLEGSSLVTQSEWGRFVRMAAADMQHRSGTVAVGFIARITEGGRQRFEDELFYAHDRSIYLVPPGKRAEYFPIKFIVPLDVANAGLLGEDQGVNAELKSALDALDGRSRLVLSPPVRLYREAPPNTHEVLMLLPVLEFAPAASSANPPSAPLRGAVFLAFRFDELVAPVLAELRRPIGLRLSELSGTGKFLLVDEARGLPPITGGERRLQLGGREYLLEFHGDWPESAGHGTSLTAAMGALLSLLLGWQVYVLTRGQERATELAGRMTAGLKASERRFALAMEAAAEGIWEWVPDRPELFLSQRCKSLLPECVWAGEHSLRKVLRALSRADRRTVLAAVRSHLARNAPCDVEVGVVARDGRELRLKLRAMAEIDSAGRVLRIAGSLSDVTELRQREARIQRSDAFLGRLVDLLPLPVLVKNEERRYVIVNRAAEQIFSAARAATSPRRGAAALAVEFAETQLRDDAYVLGQGVPVSREIEYNSPSGERLALQVRKAPITDTEGAPAVLTVITDVSPLRRAEAELRSSLDEFEALFANAPLGMAVLAPDGRMLRANPAFCRIAGRSSETLVQLDLGGVSDPLQAEVASGLFAEAAAAGHGGPMDWELLRPDGERVMTRLSLAHFETSNRQGRLWALLEDVSAARRTRLALQRADATHRSILRAIPDVLVQLDEDLRFVSFHVPERGESLPDTQVAMLGRSMEEVFSPEASQRYREAAEAALGENRLQIREYMADDGDGVLQDYEARVVPTGDGGVLLVIRRISERKQAERRLAEQERFLSALFAAMPDMVWFKDPEGRYRYCNPTYERLVGESREAMLGKSDFDYFPVAVAEGFRAIDRLVAAADGPHSNEEDIPFPDGTVWQAETIKVAVRDSLGRVSGVLGMARDITRRKQSEEALRNSELRWQFALDGAGDGVWDWDARSNRVFFSPRWLEMLGYGVGELSDRLDEWSSRIHPDDLARVMGEVGRYVAGEGETYVSEHRLRHRDGHYIWILDRGRIVERGSDGQPLRLIGTHTEITERRRAEEALRESEARFRRLADSAPVLIWMLDGGARVTYLNRTWLEFTGIEMSQGLGAGWLSSVHPEDRVRCAAAEHAGIEASRAFGLEFRLRAADGDYRWMMATAEPLYDAEDRLQGFIGSATDISELKRAEDELRRHRDELTDRVRERTEDLRAAKDAAETANLAKSQFLANMSHELRTPMHAILSYAKLGETRVDKLTAEKLRAYFERIRQSGDRLLELLNDLLDLAKLESGRLTLNRAPTDFRALVADALGEFDALLASRRLNLGLTRPEEPCMVLCDPMRMGQVVRNLLSNAAKFTPEGGDIRIVIETADQRPGRRRRDLAATRYVRFAVSDSGVGIPGGELEAIFDKFVQSSKTRTGAGGTGLGLAISREIIDAHAGRILASNNPEGGACFEVWLPLAETLQPELEQIES